MPITIISEPKEFSPASNPLDFVFTSLFTSAANFSFIVKLYINGQVHSTHQEFVQSGNNGKINVSEAIRATLSSPLVLNTALVQDYASAYCIYKIQVFEKFGEPPVLNEEDPVFSSTRIAFNGSLRHIDWINFDFHEFLPWNNNPEVQFLPFKFLTMFPRTEKDFVAMNQQKFLGVFSKTSAIELQITLFDINSNPIVGGYISQNFSGSQSISVFNIGPQNIIDNTAINLIHFASCFYYTVNLNDTGPQGSTQGQSEAYKIYVDRDCERYEWTRLHWMNKFGLWEAFTFKLVSENETEVNQQLYSSSVGTWNAANQWTYPIHQGEQKSFGTNAEDFLTLNSDWISQTLQNWLIRDLLESPKIFIERADGFERVIPTTKRYKLKTSKVDRLIQEKIEFVRTYTYSSQLN